MQMQETMKPPSAWAASFNTLLMVNFMSQWATDGRPVSSNQAYSFPISPLYHFGNQTFPQEKELQKQTKIQAMNTKKKNKILA